MEMKSAHKKLMEALTDGECLATTADEIKQYVAYKGIHKKPKTTESGIGYFEDEIGWYFKQGELKMDTDE